MDESLVKWAGPCLTFMTASAVEVEEFILRPMYVLVSLGNQQLVADPRVIQVLQQEVLKQKGSLFTASQLMFGGWFNIKVLSYQYRESHRGDKTVQCKPDISRLVGSKQWYRAMVYKWERDISGDCHEHKPGSIHQRIVSDNGAFPCLAVNSAHRQRISCHLSKVDVAVQTAS